MIVGLGWGSLIRDPQNLPVKGKWQNDGPFLPVEFLRQSNNGRLTLVIDPASTPLKVLWVELNVCKLSDAAEQLRIREGTSSANIGQWPDGSGFEFGEEIGNWAGSKGIHGVVWTALGPTFAETAGYRPSQEEAVAYLSSLSGEQKCLAREYVENAPQQIDTVYRRAIKAALGWHGQALQNL